MFERREEKRLLCADLVEVRWTANNIPRHRVANLEDISEAGLSLLSEGELEVGTAVHVRCGPIDLPGIVRHCSLQYAGYLLGVEFDESSGWSPLLFRPAHLLDPSPRLYSRPD